MPSDRFQLTTLWQQSLAPKNMLDVDHADREWLRSAFLSFRKKADVLAGEISQQFPDYTVHDVTHLDALWEIGSIIAGERVTLNAAEGFVLGGAFLVHDLGMGAATRAIGIRSSLRETADYKDILILLLRQRNEDDLGRATTDEMFEAEKLLLRETHAKEAESLPTRAWDGADGDKYHLIENDELRTFFGPLIGKVAFSHWWPYSRVRDELSEVVGSYASLPPDWTVDMGKIAALLRAADAAHLDSRRAPLFLAALRNLSEEASRHWRFQGRLARPTLDEQRLRFSASPPFGVHDADAWWLAFDMCQMVDSELRAIDDHFSSRGKPQFAAKGVVGAGSSREFARFVGIDGWYPIDARPAIRDVPALIERLGGRSLYGRERPGAVVVRELLQNAVDATNALSKLLPAGTMPETPEIRVEHTTAVDGTVTVRIVDHGVGMSETAVTDSLLNFGSSLWSSTAVRREFPGLLSVGFESVGMFGIGFFSSFMLSDRVTVRTRQFKKGAPDTLIVEFRNGLKDRPIVRRALESEFLWRGGTTIEIHDIGLDIAEFSLEGLSKADAKKRGLHALIVDICKFSMPFVNARTVVSDGAASTVLPPPSEAMSIKELIDRSHGPRTYRRDRELVRRDTLLRPVVEGDGRVMGILGTVLEDHVGYTGAVISHTGFRVGSLRYAFGHAFGTPVRAARDFARLTASQESLQRWAQEQVELIGDLPDVSADQRIRAASGLISLGADPANLPVARTADGAINFDEVRRWARAKRWIAIVDSENYQQKFDITYSPNVLFVPFSNDFMGLELLRDTSYSSGDEYLPSSLDFVEEAIASAWRKDWDAFNGLSWNVKYEWSKDFIGTIGSHIATATPYRVMIFDLFAKRGADLSDLELEVQG